MTRTRTVEAVLWDADGVLQRHGDWRRTLDDLGGVPDDFVEQVWALELQLLCGGDFPAAVEGLARRLGIAHPVEDLLAPWRDIVVLDATLEVVGRVRRSGTPCYLATNQQPYRGAWMQQTLGYGDHLDGVFYSYELGLAKPDPAYFAEVVRRLGLSPDAVLFVDDNQPNVDGARTAGLRAERWRHDDGLDALRAHLDRHGLPV